jgi:predicted dehydrogenase
MYKFAIIGCGRIAIRHAEQIAAVGKLVAVCDIIPEKAEAMATRYSVKAYSSIEDLLATEKEVNIVSICTPNGYHAEHCIKSLQAGKDVLCEKPLCITAAAAWQLIETEKFSRRKLFVVKSTRYNPYLIKLKALLEEGELGQVYSFSLNCFWNRPESYYTDWHGKLFPDGGTLYTQFSHYIDAIIWLFGELKSAKGFSENKAHKQGLEFEDTGAVAVQLKSDIIGTVNWSVNTFQKNCEIGLTLIAEKGTIRLGGEFLNELQYQQPQLLQPVSANGTPNDYLGYKGSMSNHKQVYEGLIEALDKKASHFPNGFEGLKTVEAIESIYKAVRNTSAGL